ncbi:hypothetical protein [Telmatospirillum sp.]|uniref:hypothetical protein n=1 Tax=Telmatospirillum sp. TaxID=2079197 RepID=UPI00284AFDC7|nr:hypothetical protein [Telmatospirillum sp.]MDR3439873.1 hypothetical protein [Telmatospirillum sp.]
MTLEAAGSPADATASAGSAITTETPVLRYEAPEPDPAPTDGSAVEDTSAAETVDDTEEVEHEGQKYRVPKALKDSFLRQSDYTKKTMEVAEQRKAIEVEHARLAERAKADDAHLDRLAALKVVSVQLQQFPQTNEQWAQLEQQDPARAASLFRQFQQLRGAQENLTNQVNQHQQQRTSEQQQATAKQAQEAVEVLKKAIPDFGPQTLQEIETFAVKEFGVKPEQVRAVVDPTIWLMGYKLMKAAAVVQGQISAATTETKAPVKAITQVAKGGGAKSSNGLSDNDDMDAWLAKRNAQIRASRR